tara:strand:- start:1615 stop:2538 length:924 start_codon:yes stop_codon:yes gene_type:complete
MLYIIIFALFGLTEAFSYGTVAVIGASGNLGRAVVKELCNNKISTKILNRPNTSSNINNNYNEYPNIKIVNGDVNNYESIVKLLEGVDTCIAVHGSKRKTKLIDIIVNNVNDLNHPVNVNYLGMINIINAAKKTKTKHIIRVTGNGEKTWSIPSIIINLFGSMHKAWNYAGECELRNSNISYTIIRPGIMNNDVDADLSLTLRDNGMYLVPTKISYNKIANLCLDCITHPNVKNTTLTAMTTEPAYGKSSWIPLLRKVNSDTRNFPDKLLIILKHYIAATIVSVIFLIFINTIILLPVINKLSWMLL